MRVACLLMRPGHPQLRRQQRLGLSQPLYSERRLIHDPLRSIPHQLVQAGGQGRQAQSELARVSVLRGQARQGHLHFLASDDLIFPSPPLGGLLQ